jgi:hypothetical protein
MNDDSREAAWVHTCLHRQEGDLGNAGYWYGRAGRPVAEGLVRPSAERLPRRWPAVGSSHQSQLFSTASCSTAA